MYIAAIACTPARSGEVTAMMGFVGHVDINQM
jgi:hypothetical protein